MSKMELKTKSFNIFIPAENPGLWFNYQQGLKGALERFGVERVVLSTITDSNSSDTYTILSQDSKGRSLGGIRLEIKSEYNVLPLEKIKNIFADILSQKIISQTQANYRVAEICGLWVSEEAKGRGLGADLALAATKLGINLKINTLVSMLPAHTLDHFLKLGYVPDPDLPKLAYPDDRYLSTVVWYYVPEVNKIQEIRNLDK